MAAIEFERKSSRTDNIITKDINVKTSALRDILYEDQNKIDEDIDDETAVLSPKSSIHLRPGNSNSSGIDSKNSYRLSIRMPSIPRLKSRLKSPNTILNTSKSKYNKVKKTPVTGQTIANTLKSSVDVILYDDIDGDITNDDTCTTEPTISAQNNYLEVNDHNIIDSSDTIHSTGGLDEDDILFDDDLVHRDISRSYDDDTVRCKCCAWLNKHKQSIIITVLFYIILICLQLVIDREEMSLLLIYMEFILFFLSVWLSFSLIWKSTSYLLFICTANHCCKNTFMFYLQHSFYYLGYSLLFTFCYGVFNFLQRYQSELHRLSALLENAEAHIVDMIERFFLCAMVLFWGLFVKTILIRWVCLEYYLKSHLVKIKKIKKYESWLKILLNKRQIFSIKVKKFVDLHKLHCNYEDPDFGHVHKTVAFRLDVLALQDEFNLDNDGIALHKLVMEKIDEYEYDSDGVRKDETRNNDSVNNKLVNTLTSGAMFYGLQRKYDHNIQTCLLWLYNAKTGKVTVMDDNELDKVCKQFAKFITLSITKKRLDGKTPKTVRDANPANRRATFRELTTLFAKHAGMTPPVSSIKPADGKIEEIQRANTLKTVPRLKRSSMTVGGEFVTQTEFIRCFAKLNKTKQGYEAWKDMNVSEKFLSKNELQRWLYQYLHDLIYLKQTLNSYKEILHNLDMSSNLIAIFVLFFIFLLIFDFNFIDSVSIYFSMIAIFAVFGKNVFTQFFDALYFIFVLSPFEIGDVILIDDVRYTVNKINIMSTELVTAVTNGNTLVIKSNASLLDQDIKNLSRTKSPYHNITFYISQNTSIDELNRLKFKIDSFIRHKMKNDINDIWFILDGVDKECRMKIRLFLGSIYSFSDSGLMWKQHHIINMQIIKFVNEMGIQYKRFSAQDVQMSALIEEQESRASRLSREQFSL